MSEGFSTDKSNILYMNFQELCSKLEEIKQIGYVETHRKGDTGIGKTLEDLLKIEENNVPGPNVANVELKSGRKGTVSMLTLFTKNPKPKGANRELFEEFSYEDEGRRLILHTTLSATGYNTLRGEKGLKIEINNDKIKIVDPENESWGYWDRETLEKRFERKYPALVYIKADAKMVGDVEEFWFNEAWYLEGFSFKHFVELLEEGKIFVDTRIGRDPNGKIHDHGTGFRVKQDNLDQCFERRINII